MIDRIDTILTSPPCPVREGEAIGASREGRPIRGFMFGSGPIRISLLGGCHADEPVGPFLLRRLVNYLRALPATDPLLMRASWWVIPHVNPDGEFANRFWWDPSSPPADEIDLVHYLRHVCRELPGDDVEFGFPRGEEDEHARPENRAAKRFLSRAGGRFHLHASLHGMGFSTGPWFLVEPSWVDRLSSFRERCCSSVRDLGYVLHDVDRRGEKGFVRVGEGFSTRPDSVAMRDHFLALGDLETAGRFRPSSMETVRGFGGDPLTLVSEMPLFVVPKPGDAIRERVDRWRVLLSTGGADQEASVVRESAAAGVRPMPIRDQMWLQLSMIAFGLMTIEVGSRR